MTEEAVYKKEKTGWSCVNAELRKHGLQVVEFLSPTKALQTADVVHMEVAMSRRLQENLSSLMKDCDRRQALVQDLILTNSQLKKDLEKQQIQFHNSESKVHDLKIMLDNAKDKIQDLEYENMHNTSYMKEEEEKIHNTKQAIHHKYSQLKVKCAEQQEEIDLLQQRLKALHAENEKRMTRQHEVFSKFRKKGPRSHTVAEDRVLDIIDTYEADISQLKKEIDIYRHGENKQFRSSPLHRGSVLDNDDSTPNFKAIIKSYERQLRDTKQTVRHLEDEAEMRKLELQARPELKDFRAAQQRIKNLETLMRRHRISDRDANVIKEKKDPSLKYSTLIEDLEFLPVTYTRKYLRQVSEEVGAYDLDDLVPKVQTMTRLAEAYPKLEQFSKQVLELVREEDLPHPSGLPHEAVSRRSHAVWCDKTANHMLTVLTYWQQQMLAIPDLMESLNQLVSALMPWRERKLSGNFDVRKLTDVVDSLVYDEEIGERKKESKGQPSLVVMSGIVEHFQQLFDVSKISGVYPRMNDIYTRLGEAQNVLHTLRDLLGLDEKSKSSAIVEAVGRLCQQHNITTTDQLQELFAVESLDKVVQKLHEHEEFLPVFQEVVDQLFTVLNVDQLDQVVPAVQALKVLATVNS